MTNIQVKRGIEANLPSLNVGEPALTLDSERIFIGAPSGNKELVKQSDLIQLATHSFKGAKFITLDAYPRITPEVTDEPRILRAINDAPIGSTIVLSDASYDIASTIAITKSIHLFGFDAELKTVTNGMDNTLQFTGIDGFSVVGVKFNQNLIGRTSININNCKNFFIEKCYFTGYSSQYGYYQTDGGIRISDSQVGKIAFNTWEDHGALDPNLNRCISIQGYTTDHITGIGNTFNRVMQAVVVSSGANNVFTGNTFREVHDNSFYILHQIRGITITGNNFDDKYDECIVLSGRNITISGNNFKDTPNKFIAITGGGVTNLTVTGNTFEVDRPNAWVSSHAYVVDDMVIASGNRYRCTVAGTSGTTAPSATSGNSTDGTVTWVFEDVFIDPGVGAQLLVIRNSVGYPPLNNITFSDNVIKGAFGYAVVQLENITGFKCENNNFDVMLSNDYDHIVKINAASAGSTNSGISIKHNRFKQSGVGANIYAVRFENESLLNSTVDGNITDNCRMSLPSTDVLIRNQYAPSTGYYYTATNSITEGDSTPSTGYYRQGDIVLNRNVNEPGSNGAKYATFGWRRLNTGNTHVLDTDWRVLKIPLSKEDGGKAQFSGNGSTTTFLINHTMAVSPAFLSVTANSSDAASDFYVTSDSSKLTVTYKTAPPAGTNNVSLFWHVKG